MDQKKATALADYLDVNRWLVSSIEGRENIFKIKSETYLVLTTKEAGEYETEHRESCKDAVVRGAMEDFDDDQTRGELLAPCDGVEHRHSGYYIYHQEESYI